MTTKREYLNKIEVLKRVIFHFVTETNKELLDEVKKKVLADIKIIRDEYYSKADAINAEKTQQGVVEYIMKNLNRLNL